MATVNSKSFLIGASLRNDALSLHFQALSRALTKRGHRVLIISPRTSKDDNSLPGVEGCYWPSARPTTLRDAALVWRLIDSRKPDCLIANFATVNWLCALGCIRRVPCRIAWYHTLSRQIDVDSPLSKRVLKLLRFRKRLIYATATHVATNSQAAQLDIRNTFGVSESKCHVWQNSIPDPIVGGLPMGLEERDKVIVCVGRFDATKGQDVLVRAISLCGDRLPGFRVDFLGKGPTLDTIKRLADHLGVGNKCRFVGEVSHAEVLKAMAKASIVVVPSRSEAFGLVNIEAMSVATPIVASRAGGIPEIIRHGVEGLLVDPDSPRALSDEILFLLENPDMRLRLGANARARFVAQFEQAKVVQAQVDWLESLLGG